jgi:hypothetical protein
MKRQRNGEKDMKYNSDLYRATRQAAESAIEMAFRQLEHSAPANLGWPKLSPEELVASEFRRWLSEEMNEARERAR